MFWVGFEKRAASSGAKYKKDDSNPVSDYEEETHIVGPKPSDRGHYTPKGSAKIDKKTLDPNLEYSWGGPRPEISYTGGVAAL